MPTLRLLLPLIGVSILAAPVTVTMDEVPFQPVNGLVVSKGGIDFTFVYTGPDAFYNSTGPGITTYVADPSIEGANSGSLTILFSQPVQSVAFGIAFAIDIPVDDIATFEVFDGITPVSSQSINIQPLVSFAEAFVSYAGSPITSMQVSFAPDFDLRFAFDNLTVNAEIPEPSSVLMLALGAATCLVRIRRG